MRTFETRILTDESSAHILSSYAKLFAKIERHLLKLRHQMLITMFANVNF
jgi:hypothetical protein